MISLRNVTVTYDGALAPALRDVSITVDEGELVLVVGPTGGGKSTLLAAVSGLVPHFTGGTLAGEVRVAGRSTRTHRPRDLADLVASVRQNPASSFVTDMVEDELAYGMETLGVAPSAMRRRVEEILDLLGLAQLRRAPLRALSGGEQQRVAIGAAMASGARVLVLDEPTSALDPVAAEDVLSTVSRLVHDLGMTVLLAEHRLERVVHHADGVVLVSGGTASAVLEPATAMYRSAVVPPVIDLGRAMGWSPLPLSVRAARRAAGALRADLAAIPAPAPAVLNGPIRASVDRVTVQRGAVIALRDSSLSLRAGTVTAVMGRNGSGKSTLLHTLAGQHRPHRGTARLMDADPARLRPGELVARLGFVPQNPLDLLYGETVAQECADADRDNELPAGTTRALLDRILGGVPGPTHPRDLSAGQQLALALAVVLAPAPPVLLLDEPTRGLDYRAKAALVELVRQHRGAGTAVAVATHDVELAAELADEVVLLADGEIVATERARAFLAGSPAFSPQVARVVYPVPFLTASEVVSARTRSTSGQVTHV